MSPTLLGSLILVVPAVALAWLVLWRRHRPVFWGTLGLIAVALGYLIATGAARDIGAHFAATPATSHAPAR